MKKTTIRNFGFDCSDADAAADALLTLFSVKNFQSQFFYAKNGPNGLTK
jgi:hypothetical protein